MRAEQESGTIERARRAAPGLQAATLKKGWSRGQLLMLFQVVWNVSLSGNLVSLEGNTYFFKFYFDSTTLNVSSCILVWPNVLEPNTGISSKAAASPGSCLTPTGCWQTGIVKTSQTLLYSGEAIGLSVGRPIFK